MLSDRGTAGKRQLYTNELIDKITEQLNTNPRINERPTFLRALDFETVDFFKPNCFDKFEGGASAYARSIEELNAKALTPDRNYVLIFNTGNHFISVSVQKTKGEVNYIVQDSGDKNYGEINSLGEYIAKVGAANVEEEFAQRKANIQEDPYAQTVLDGELYTAIEQEKQAEIARFSNLKTNLETFLQNLFGVSKVTEYSKGFRFIQPNAASCGPAAILAAEASFNGLLRAALSENVDERGIFTTDFASAMVIENMCILHQDLGFLKCLLEQSGGSLRQFAENILTAAGDGMITQDIIKNSIPQHQDRDRLIEDLLKDTTSGHLKLVLTQIVQAYRGPTTHQTPPESPRAPTARTEPEFVATIPGQAQLNMQEVVALCRAVANGLEGKSGREVEQLRRVLNSDRQIGDEKGYLSNFIKSARMNGFSLDIQKKVVENFRRVFFENQRGVAEALGEEHEYAGVLTNFIIGTKITEELAPAWAETPMNPNPATGRSTQTEVPKKLKLPANVTPAQPADLTESAPPAGRSGYQAVQNPEPPIMERPTSTVSGKLVATILVTLIAVIAAYMGIGR